MIRVQDDVGGSAESSPPLWGLVRGAPLRDQPLVWLASLTFVTWLIAVPVLVRLTSTSASSDIIPHAELAKRVIESGAGLSYTLWYPLVYWVSGGAESHFWMRFASIGLLTFFVTLKVWIVYAIALKMLRSRPFAIVTALASALAMPLINPAEPTDVYLGQITPNVWHNSTNIFAAPFVILAFVAAWWLLNNPNTRTALAFAGFMTVSILAKPNYALSFLPVLGVALLVIVIQQRVGFLQSVKVIALAFALPAAVLVAQYAAVYGGSFVRESQLVLDPLVVWSVHSNNIALSILLSIAGPFAVLFTLSRTERTHRRMLAIAWATLAVGAAEMALFAETVEGGKITAAGNWFWGAYSAMLVVFVLSLIELFRAVRSRVKSSEQVVALFVAGMLMLAHVLSGVYYVMSIGMNGWAY